MGASLLARLDRSHFKVPEIIFNPTLVFSPHGCHLDKLFKGFKMISTTDISREREITGVVQITKLYLLRYVVAEAFDGSEEITGSLQNVMLQDRYPHLHLTLQVDVEVDVQGIIRKTGSQTLLVRFVCFSTLIDTDGTYKLSTEESKPLNELQVVRARQDTVTNASGSGKIVKPSWNAPIWIVKPPLATLTEGAFSE
ncbi:hypothetical protein EYZ11_002560 [Aspergillus tanneri]|uniref:Uncharacterized protein n=1 Tax=Aspergillus tanneri TaxID=1220188 RepID=A0A4S3JRB3_9EURO|nr:hypothetical protein EYZ11_002560 [Aspergillus tanneri]